ncbi:MAG: ABC transporter ATP-binding protein [Pseudomonadota bacterium]
MARVKLENVVKAYGDVEVLHGIDLDINAGEFMVFVGPSGCGKSTLLRLIAGLEDISSGSMTFDGEMVNTLSPSQRGIAMVFQSYALYPHMTVFENMAFGLSLAKAGKDEIDRKVRDAAEILQITPYLERLPKELSGGQRQRVAIGRAITRDPRVFLFDEPLSNLDAALRGQTRIEIANLHSRMAGSTMIYVTHDQVEAMTLADRIVVLRDGRIEQVGTPMELYTQPANVFVAQFIGAPSMNIVPATVTAGEGMSQVAPNGGSGAIPVPLAGGAQDRVSLGVRPEDLTLAAEGEAVFSGPVSHVEQLGEVVLAYLDIGQADTPLIAKLPGTSRIERGQVIHLSADPSASHVFDAKGAAIPRAA